MFEKIKSIFGTKKKTNSMSTATWLMLDEFGGEWSKGKFLKQFEENAIVNACVRKRAEKIGQLDFEVYRGETKIDNHNLLKVLKKPNNRQSGSEFFELYQIHKDLAGLAVVLCLPSLNNIKEMYLLQPDNCELQWDKSGELNSVLYTQGTNRQKYSADNIILSMSASPLDQLKTSSILVGSQSQLGTAKQLEEYQNNVLKNGGKVGGILKFNQEMTEKQINKIKQDYQKKYSGANKSNKLVVLQNGAEFQDLGLTPTEMGYSATKKDIRDLILLTFGVPKPILAVNDDVNRASAEVAIRVFLQETIKPLADDLIQNLNEFLLPEGYTVQYKEFIEEEQDKKLKYYENGLKEGWLTINEVREYEGLEPLKGGDEPLIKFGLDKLSNIESFSEEKQVKKKILNLKNSKQRKQYHKEWIQRHKIGERKLKREMKKFWKGQAKRAIDEIKSKTKRLDLNKENELLQALMEPLIKQYILQGGEDAVNLHDLENIFVLTPEIENAIEEMTERISKEINKTTKKKLDKVIGESLDNNDNYRETADKVDNLFDNFGKSRALTVARTTTTTAMQTGQFNAYKQNSVPIKIWVAVGDDRTRDSHILLDGEERPLNVPFSNGLMFPGEGTGNVDEIVNCRCSI